MRTERCRPQIETAKTCISAYALYSIRCGEKFVARESKRTIAKVNVPVLPDF